jgi:hypothetical protein
MFYKDEPLKIEGPGLGVATKSYTKFRDIDASEAVYFGLALGRKWDESFVNKFDINHSKFVSEMEFRRKRNFDKM